MAAILGHFRLSFPVILVAFLAPVAVQADTYGLPPATEFEKEWRADKTALKGPEIILARSAAEWAALWKRHAPEDKEPPAVDFRTQMVVGVATPACQMPRAVYRVELDDAAAPKELLVRVTTDDAICQKPRNVRIKGARLHLAVTPKSALPVRFIQDGMVDGRVFGLAGGVDKTALGRIAGLKANAGKTRAAYREQAEKLVRNSLKDAEVTRLKKRLWPGTFGDRYPQLWSVVRVRRLPRYWTIEYDGLAFRVEVRTGAVTRIRPR